LVAWATVSIGSGEPVPEESILDEYIGPGSKLHEEVNPTGPNSFEFKLVGQRK